MPNAFQCFRNGTNVQTHDLSFRKKNPTNESDLIRFNDGIVCLFILLDQIKLRKMIGLNNSTPRGTNAILYSLKRERDGENFFVFTEKSTVFVFKW